MGLLTAAIHRSAVPPTRPNLAQGGRSKLLVAPETQLQRVATIQEVLLPPPPLAICWAADRSALEVPLPVIWVEALQVRQLASPIPIPVGVKRAAETPAAERTTMLVGITPTAAPPEALTPILVGVKRAAAKPVAERTQIPVGVKRTAATPSAEQIPTPAGAASLGVLQAAVRHQGQTQVPGL